MERFGDVAEGEVFRFRRDVAALPYRKNGMSARGYGIGLDTLPELLPDPDEPVIRDQRHHHEEE